jgi:diguanylate cyclase (GGDEF)-like protein
MRDRTDDCSVQLGRILESWPDVVLVVDRGVNITYRSRESIGAIRIGGVGDRLTDVLHPSDVSRVALLVERLSLTPGMVSTIRVRVRSQSDAWCHVEATFSNLVADEMVSGVVVWLQDVGRWVALEHQLRRQALHDPLTGLPNRVLFRDRLDHALVRERNEPPVGLLLFDLDGFKAVNDSFGHAAGDELLVTIAERLQGLVRVGETVARFGGDEFAILLERVEEPADACWVAARILEQLRMPILLQAAQLHVNASVGIAVRRDGAQDADALFRDADVAMYAAKSQGGGRYVLFEPRMRVAVRERLQLETELRRALDRHELFVQYQPLVELDTGVLSGAEVLLRWRHPRRGVLQPGEFISVAEDTGLIVPIGRWVLERACQDLERWQTRSGTMSPLQLSVNLSTRQLRDPGLPEVVAQALRRSTLDASQLVLELPESSLLAAQNTGETLIALKALGVKIAIDGFGTSDCGLRYLEDLPVDILKIDRVFVSGAHTERPHARWAFAQSIIQLAANLGLTATAAGIEDADQWQALASMGCQTGQGFHFAHPVDAIDIENLLMARQHESVASRSGFAPTRDRTEAP